MPHCEWCNAYTENSYGVGVYCSRKCLHEDPLAQERIEAENVKILTQVLEYLELINKHGLEEAKSMTYHKARKDTIIAFAMVWLLAYFIREVTDGIFLIEWWGALFYYVTSVAGAIGTPIIMLSPPVNDAWKMAEELFRDTREG